MKRVVEESVKRVVVRRRRFTQEFRRLVVKETLVPGASVSAIALKHQLNTNLVFTWRRQYLHELSGTQSVTLLPVMLEPADATVPVGTPEPRPRKHSARDSSSPGCIEIEVYGACIRLKGAVDAAALRTVLHTLSGR